MAILTCVKEPNEPFRAPRKIFPFILLTFKKWQSLDDLAKLPNNKMKEEVLKQTWSLLKAQIKNSVSFDSARKRLLNWKLLKKVEKHDRKKSNLVMTFSRSSSSSWLFAKQDNGLSVAHNPTHLTVCRNSVSEAFNSHWFFIKINASLASKFFCNFCYFLLKSRRKIAINKCKIKFQEKINNSFLKIFISQIFISMNIKALQAMLLLSCGLFPKSFTFWFLFRILVLSQTEEFHSQK